LPRQIFCGRRATNQNEDLARRTSVNVPVEVTHEIHWDDSDSDGGSWVSGIRLLRGRSAHARNWLGRFANLKLPGRARGPDERWIYRHRLALLVIEFFAEQQIPYLDKIWEI